MLATNVTNDEISNLLTNPRDLKRKLARTLVAMYYDDATAQDAENEFDAIFVKKEIPDNIEEFHLTDNAIKTITDVIVFTKLAPTKSEARRLIEQGGVSIDGNKISDATATFPAMDFVLKVGKRKFLKIIQQLS